MIISYYGDNNDKSNEMSTTQTSYRAIAELYDENDLMVALALLYVDDWLLQHLLPIVTESDRSGRLS